MSGPVEQGPGALARLRGRRAWLYAAAIFILVHVAVLGPQTDDGSYIVDRVFRPDSAAILDGEKPYRDRDYEYPPLSIPLLVAPEAINDREDGVRPLPGLVADSRDYRVAFGWEMIVFDLLIVALLAAGLRRAPPGRLWTSLAVYSAGLFLLGHLPLARFDLAPAALCLGAVVARRESRSATWSALLSAATAVKAFPLLLAPALLRGERRLARVVLAAIVPLAAAAVVVIAFGDDFGSAISYHSNRMLQVEAVGATPLLIAHELGAHARVVYSSGSFNLEASGADAARSISLIAFGIAYLLALAAVWRRELEPGLAAAGVLAIAVVLAPVLSPQFLLWVLPVSALVFGLAAENLVLLAAVVATRVMLDHDQDVANLGGAFVWSSAIRNALLLVYLALVCTRLAGLRRSTSTPSSENTVRYRPEETSIRT